MIRCYSGFGPILNISPIKKFCFLTKIRDKFTINTGDDKVGIAGIFCCKVIYLKEPNMFLSSLSIFKVSFSECNYF